jgi:hypothetical protein
MNKHNWVILIESIDSVLIFREEWEMSVSQMTGCL